MSEKMSTQPTLEAKRAKFTAEEPKKNSSKAIAYVVLAVALAVGGYLVFRGSGDSNAKNGVIFAPDAVKISLADVSGTAKFLDYKVDDNTNLRFFALKSSDGKYRAAMDACETCYDAKKGYHQEADNMVCNNCGMKFPSQMINEAKGGCHPIGLPCAVEDGQLVIKTSDIASNKNFFK